MGYLAFSGGMDGIRGLIPVSGMRIVLLFLLTLLTGCESPTARFDTFRLPRAVNLIRELGPEPLLLGTTDTLALRLQFDAATGFTHLQLRTNSAAQPWFTARAFRFHGLYYLVEERPETGYWVHAVRIGRGQVQGLGTGYRQMQALSEAAWQGHWPQLLAPDGDSMRLRFDARQLRPFYEEQAAQAATYQLASRPASSGPAPALPVSAPTVYPNPASTEATVASTTAARTVQLYDERGRLLHEYPISAAQLTIPVAGLANGYYLVRILPAGPGRPTTVRLAVAH